MLLFLSPCETQFFSQIHLRKKNPKTLGDPRVKVLVKTLSDKKNSFILVNILLPPFWLNIFKNFNLFSYSNNKLIINVNNAFYFFKNFKKSNTVIIHNP